MNNQLMFSSKSDEWSTPQDFWDKINEEFHFNLDAAATIENHKCTQYFTIADNGLLHDWFGVVWLNPPYSKIYNWVNKAAIERLKGVKTVMLIPARTDTKYFHQFIWNHELHECYDGVEVRFIKGRLKFGGSKNSAPFPSMLVIFNP